MQYITSVGEILIDFIPTRPLQLGEPCYTPFPGGAPANVAVAIARLDGPARFIGKVSTDTLGELLSQTLQTEKVDTRFMLTTSAPTAMTIVSLKEDGQRSFTFFRTGTADMLLDVREVEAMDWSETAICHVGSVLLSSDPSRSATIAAIEQAQARGAVISFDINFRPALWESVGEFRSLLTKVIPQVNVLKLSSEEAGYVDSPTQAFDERLDREGLRNLGLSLLTQGPSLVVITMDADGALLLTREHQVHVSADAIKPIDTTGAGDAFMGSLLTGLLQLGYTEPAKLSLLTEDELRRLGGFANRVAGLSCTRPGGIASLPFAHEIEPL
ncbi:MAG TPA: carbohydrate kinase [Ktedonobacteraceae bacterium]|nr:carbohydrate kinase [Ktedonobacteraceae bacterium]